MLIKEKMMEEINHQEFPTFAQDRELTFWAGRIGRSFLESLHRDFGCNLPLDPHPMVQLWDIPNMDIASPGYDYISLYNVRRGVESSPIIVSADPALYFSLIDIMQGREIRVDNAIPCRPINRVELSYLQYLGDEVMRIFHEYWSRHETFSYGFRGTVPSYWNLRPVPFGQDDLFIYLNFAIKLGSYENGMDKLGNCFISLRAREYKDIISSKIGLDECWQLETQMGETAEPVKEVLSPNEVDDILAKIDSDFGPCTPDNPP